MSDTQKHTKPNVPNLRFPGAEGEWEQHLLSEYLEFKNGLNPSAKSFGEGIKFISVMDILNNPFITYDCIRASVAATDKEKEEFCVEYGDILFQRSSETLEDVGHANVYLDSRPALFGGFTIRGKKKGEYNPLFFKYLLDSPRARKRIIVKGAGAQHFNIGQEGLSSVSLFFPAMQEQNKIAELLELLDQRIAIQNKVIEDLKCVKESITRRLINKKDESSCIVTLGEITEIVSRRNKNKVNYPMYSVTNDKGFVPQQEQFGDREMVGEDIGAYKIVLKDEIAYNPARINVGSIGQYTGDSPCMISSLYVCIKARKGIDSKWLIQILRSEHLVYYYNLFAEGGVRLYLFYPNFSRIRVTLPPLEQQSRIAAILGQIENKIELESSILSGYKQTKQALLCKLFV